MKKLLICLLLILCFGFAEKYPKINGFFVQPMLGYGIPDYLENFKTQEYYDNWVKSMSDIGATMLFYQWVSHYEVNQGWFSQAYGGASSADFCYYHPDLTEISGVPVNSWMPAINYWTGDNISPVQRVLDAGERNNVKIWLGLYLNENGTFNWWDAVADNDISPQDSATFRYHVERSVDLVRDLVDKFGNHPALGGFYYPIEIANLGFQERETWDILVWLLDSVATQVHKLSGKKLAISPFFNVNLTSGADWGEMWDYALSRSAIDIIMLQDGVGVEPNILTETNDLVSPYYEAVRDACHRNGKSFWANSELFKNSSGKRDTLIASPSSIEKLLLQLNTEAEFADTFVCFSYLALDPYVQVTPLDADYPLNQRQKLYNDYKEYYESIKNEEGGQGETAVEKRKLDLPNYRISVSGRNITIPKMDKPVHYSLVSPNGKVILSGIAKDKCTIKAPVQYGIYIFMTGFTDALPMRQKIFIQKDIQSTVDYQLRSR